MKPCKHCNGTGTIKIAEVYYVTRDMAMDAERPEIEGQEIWEEYQEQCDACQGTGFDIESTDDCTCNDNPADDLHDIWNENCPVHKRGER